MPFDLTTLHILQHRDNEIVALESTLKRFPSMQELARQRLDSDQQSVVAIKKEIQDLKKNVGSVELDVQTRRQSIVRLTQQQFETRKNEEYRSIGIEIENYTKEIDGLETQELELLEQIDEAQTRLEKAEHKLSLTSKSVEEELAAIEQKLNNAQKRLGELQKLRKNSESKVEDKDLLGLYQRLQKNYPGDAIAEVTEEALCCGCHMKVTASTYLRVQKGRELVQCESCSRIIHPGLLAPIEDILPEDEEEE